MKRTILLALLVTSGICATSTPATATEVGRVRRFGLGFVLGDPTGLTGKFWLGPKNALDFGLGFGSYGFRGDRCWTDSAGRVRCDGNNYGSTSLNVDYLWQSNIAHGQVDLDWYIGVGGRIWFWNYRNSGYYDDGLSFAVRAPIGLALMFANPAFLELFLEITPNIRFWHGAWFTFDGAFGVRFYF